MIMSTPKLLQAQAEDGLLPRIFAEINPVTGVPAKGAWLTSLMIAIPAFLLDLEAISFVVSCTNLLVFSFMSAFGIVLRFRNEEDG